MKLIKTCILPLVLVLLITYYVSAAAETSQDEKEANVVKEANKDEKPKQINQGGGRVCRYGCCGGWRGRYCTKCCRSGSGMEETKMEEEPEEIEPEQSGGRGCRYGCCGGYTRFGCRKCCRPKESVVVAEKDEHVVAGHGGGGGWGGGCRYGCCGRNYSGRCYKCCHSAAEANAYDENEAKP